MTNKPEQINNAYSPLPENQNPTAQTKRTNFGVNQAPNSQTEPMSRKEVIEIIKKKSQISGEYEGFKSLHR